MEQHLVSGVNLIEERAVAVLSRPLRLIKWVYSELRWFFRVLISAGDRFYWGNGFSRAASLAYTSLLSLIPVTTIGFGMLASYAASAQYIPELRQFIFRHYVPNPETVDRILGYFDQISPLISALNIPLLGFFVISAILLLNSIEYTLNEIWQVFEARTISHRVAIFCAIMVIAPILLLSTYYFVQLSYQHLQNEPGIDGYLSGVYKHLLPFLIDFVAFLCLYFLVPKAPVRMNSAAFGAFLTALLFGAAKAGFAIYIEHFASYEKVYGTLMTIPIFLFWLYLTWSIVLFGAECSYQAQYLPREGKLWKRTLLSIGDGSMLIAVQCLVIIAKNFMEGKALPGDIELCERLGCSSPVLKPTLDALAHAGIIARGDSGDMPLVLLRAPDTIKLHEISEALYKGRNSLHFPAQMKKLYACFQDGVNGNSNATLADIVNAS